MVTTVHRIQLGVLVLTCPGCSQGVWNSACWQVSFTFLYLGRLLVCWVFTESSFFLRIFLRNTKTQNKGIIVAQLKKKTCVIFFSYKISDELNKRCSWTLFGAAVFTYDRPRSQKLELTGVCVSKLV